MQTHSTINFDTELLPAESSIGDSSGGIGSAQMCVFCTFLLIMILLFRVL